MRKLFLVDFDNTLVRENSLRVFFLKTLGLSRFSLVLVESLALTLSSRSCNGSVKEVFKGYFYKKAFFYIGQDDLEQGLQKAVSSLTIGREVAQLIKDKRSPEDYFVVVSASPHVVIEGYLKLLGIIYDKIIATELYTGIKYAYPEIGDECNLENKVVRIGKELDISIFDQVIAIGNEPQDLAMIGLADEGFIICKKSGQIN